MNTTTLCRSAVAAVTAALLTSGCASDAEQVEDDATVEAAEDVGEDTGQDVGEDTVEVDEEPDDSDRDDAVERAVATEGPVADAVFLTAVDEVVAGTVYEGLVDVTPGEFLLTATLVCDRLDAGESRTDVLSYYLEVLGAGEASEDDARLAGALVGAGIEVYCPGHTQ